jgi:hypothetical protein
MTNLNNWLHQTLRFVWLYQDKDSRAFTFGLKPINMDILLTPTLRSGQVKYLANSDFSPKNLLFWSIIPYFRSLINNRLFP